MVRRAQPALRAVPGAAGVTAALGYSSMDERPPAAAIFIISVDIRDAAFRLIDEVFTGRGVACLAVEDGRQPK
jgi:hypothetical protein